MTASVSMLPPQSGWMLPAPSVLGLSDDEQRLLSGLSSKLAVQAPAALQRWAYYDGRQRLSNLGISIPPQLAGVRSVVDWPRGCVDPLIPRVQPAGFRLPGSTEVDSELQEHWRANDMSGEFPLAVLDSLVVGRGYIIVGAPDVAGDSPLVTVESPLNMTVTWDPRTRQVINGYQAFEVEGTYQATFYLPNQTVYMSREDMSSGGWVIYHRDVHNFGEVPIVRVPNRSRTSDREGRSQITEAIMSATDSACRSLLGMEIAREVYSIPRLAIIGASESDFVDAQGNSKSSIDMAMTKVLALERDKKGEAPSITQLTAFDPAVFTKIIDMGAQQMSAYTGFPASYFGQVTTANPASADAIRVAESGIDRQGEQLQNQATGPLRKVAQLIWRTANGGQPLPAEMRRVEVDWIDARTATPAATTDAMTKQIASGAVPATSDVTLAALGYTPLQRARLAQDRDADPTMAIVTALASSLVTKLARADNAVAKDLETAGVITPALRAAVLAEDVANEAKIAANSPEPPL